MTKTSGEMTLNSSGNVCCCEQRKILVGLMEAYCYITKVTTSIFVKRKVENIYEESQTLHTDQCRS